MLKHQSKHTSDAAVGSTSIHARCLHSLSLLTRCSAIAERPHCRVRY